MSEKTKTVPVEGGGLNEARDSREHSLKQIELINKLGKQLDFLIGEKRVRVLELSKHPVTYDIEQIGLALQKQITEMVIDHEELIGLIDKVMPNTEEVKQDAEIAEVMLRIKDKYQL